MKTTKKNYSKFSSKTIVAIKVMAFLSWLLLLGIAFANNMIIEGFIFSLGIVTIGYLLFGRASQRRQQSSSSIIISQASNGNSTNTNYLDVFFHSSHHGDPLNTTK